MDGLQVFYGENEAGKSTIMSFIHSVLFGFPTKQQSELRYEPKEGAKYGGQLTAVFPAKGKAVIERVKGKAVGDVSVFLDDGTIGGEELLNELLLQVDKSLFQSIFSFNIHGLQNIHQIKSEDLGRFLFSAGALGTDQLLRAENTLQKELENRFKPNGKKPIINEKLKEIKQIHNELKKAEQKNEQYWLLLHEKENLEQEIAEKQSLLLNSQTELSKLESWKQIQPLIVKEETLTEELERYKDICFPIDGISRLERLEEKMTPLEGQMASIVQRIVILKEDVQKNMPNQRLLEKEAEIIAAVESVTLLEKLKQEEIEVAGKLNELIQTESAMKEKLHLTISEEDLSAINTSVFMKEKVIDAQEKHRRLKIKRLDLDEKFNEEKQQLEETEEKISLLKGQLLPKIERVTLEEKMKTAEKKVVIEKELQYTEDKLVNLYKTAKKEKEKVNKKRAQDRLQFVLLGVFFISLIAWGTLGAEWMIVFAGALGIAFLLYLFFKKPSFTGNDFIHEEIKALKERKQQLIQKINDSDLQNTSFFESQLSKDKEISAQLRHYKLQMEQRNEQYEKVLVAFEVWEKEMVESERKMVELGKALFLSRQLALSHLVDAFQIIEQLKEILRKKASVKDQQINIASRKSEIVERMNQLCTDFLENKSSNIEETAYLLRKSLKEETQKQIMLQERKGKLVELQEDYQNRKLELAHLHSEQEKILQLANAETAEKYRGIGHLAETKANLEGQLKDLHMELKHSALSEIERDRYKLIENLDHVINDKAEQMKKLSEAIPVCQSDLAKKKYEIQVLEEGGIYADLLHKYKQLKAELEGEAREWARFAMAKNILERTVERFKKESLPRMLVKAEEFLSILTEGNYVRIYPKKDSSGFLIESKKQILFEANELSQATTEQIYVAFRLALAETVYAKYPFPIIIDDSFVNFDGKRTEKVINLLKSISGRQILFFTCHKHLLSHFYPEQIIRLNEEISLIAD